MVTRPLQRVVETTPALTRDRPCDKPALGEPEPYKKWSVNEFDSMNKEAS